MSQMATTGWPVIGRLFSLLLGPAVLLILAAALARDGSGWLTMRNSTFLVVLGGVLIARLAEFRGGDPRTATGEPATTAHLRHFCVQAVALGFGVWILANLIGNKWPAQ